MTPQLRAAFGRALYQAVILGLTTALTVWATTDEVKTIIIAAGTAFLGPLALRGVVEGAIDSQRAAAGDIKPADVAYNVAMGYQQPGQPVNAPPPTDPAGWGINRK